MAKSIPIINKKTKKFEGSVGVGRHAIQAVPVAPAAFPPITPPASAHSVTDAWNLYRLSAPSAAPAPTALADVNSADLWDRLVRLDRLGTTVADKLMDIRERECHARGSFSLEARNKAQALRNSQQAVHIAVIQAREELRHAQAHVDGSYDSFAPVSSSVLEADALSAQAATLADLIADQDHEALEAKESGSGVFASQADADAAAQEFQGRRIRAGRHILAARRVLDEALNNAI